MDKYLIGAINAARFVGSIKEMEMAEASKWLPARIEIAGTTGDGEKFTLCLKVGNPKAEESNNADA